VTTPPSDQAVRDRAERDLDTSFVIEAGAGTGKTRLLVGRVLALIDAGRPLERIVAITFTEKAASEMKLRLRDALGRRRGDPRVDAALRAVEVAPITTIHAFASGLLRRFPVEAGVDPSFAVADEARALALRDAAWQEYVAEVLGGAPAALDRALLLGFAAGQVEPALRELAFALASSDAQAPPPAPGDPDPGPALQTAARALREAIGLAEAHRVAEDDTLVAEARRLLAETDACSSRPGAEREVLLQQALPWVKSRKGSRARWHDPAALEEARRLVAVANDERLAARAAISHDIARGLVEIALGFRAVYGAAKDAASVLDFDDLLLAARRLLASSPAVRARAAAEYDALVVDEFQDTDPVQAEIVWHLAVGAGDVPAPGRLFVVGDPKQSIYAFRGADIEAYAAFRERLRDKGGVVDAIHESFRPVRPVLELTNALASHLLPARATALQPAHAPLSGGAEPPDERPSVVVIAPLQTPARPASGREGAPGEGDEREDAAPALPEDPTDRAAAGPAEAEAAAVAGLLRTALDEGWPVRDRAGGRRPLRPGDVGILLPAMTAPLEAYEEALQAEGIAYVVSGGKRFYRSVEVTALLAAVSAIDDPGNRLALVAALRSPLFGLSDDAIVRRAARRSGLTILEPGGDDEVAPALRILADLHRDRDRIGAARTLGALLDRTGTLGAFALKPHGHQRVQNLLKLVDEARRLADAEGLSFRRLARILAERLEGQHAAAQAPAAEAGQEAVEILTVHKAKGLEFGLVVLGALSHVPAGDRARALVRGGVAEGAAGAKRGVRFETAGFEAARAELEERREAEARRLLYVALTRARDTLVLPLVPHGDRLTGSPLGILMDAVPAIAELARGAVHAELCGVPIALHRVGPDPTHRRPPSGIGVAEVLEAIPFVEPDPFVHDREELIRRASRAIVHRSPSRPDVAEEDEAGEGRGWLSAPARRPAVGAAVGTAVHLALEAADLHDPAAARALAAAHARALGLAAVDAARAGSLVETALSSSVVARARAAARSWRELPFTLAIEGGVLEGSVDLVFEEAGELVIVDYKTDAVPASAVDVRMKAHRRQIAEYALAIAELGGRPVREAVVLFLSAAESRTLRVTPALLAEVRAALRRPSPQGALF